MVCVFTLIALTQLTAAAEAHAAMMRGPRDKGILFFMIGCGDEQDFSLLIYDLRAKRWLLGAPIKMNIFLNNLQAFACKPLKVFLGLKLFIFLTLYFLFTQNVFSAALNLSGFRKKNIVGNTTDGIQVTEK